ncbi:type I restriction-modification system subunit M N-terminal domain-containing protein [Ureaplasma diversum]|uniref:type I restriction-modification system subunit M N-terminal domain-containing protein n=1 Tax=Ureaplasma diversum TaxID=42094 RepID=UPI000690009E|nr:type I restriction-modification system subunit M N-terminal domain-containing protein [Ureaplasma diversum]
MEKKLSFEHNKPISFIWSIADDCLRDVYVRGKYRDIIIPMTVIRRFDAVFEKYKADFLKEVEKYKNLGFKMMIKTF